MSLYDLVKTTQDITTEINEAARLTAETSLSLLLAPIRYTRSERKSAKSGLSEGEQHFRLLIWKVRHTFQNFAEGGADAELFVIFKSLAAHRNQVQRAIVVWTDLLEILVQKAEERHDTAPGKGQLKAAEVKASVQYLFRSDRIDIPHVPQFLEPIILDSVVSWSVDAIVLMANRYGFWSATVVAAKPSAGRRFLTAIWAPIRKFVLWSMKPFGWMVERIYMLLKSPYAISPELKAALDAIEHEGMLFRDKNFLSATMDLFEWAGSHSKALMGVVEVTFAVVQEVEGALELKGSEKKAYARDLVFAVLAEFGFTQREGLMFILMETVVDGVIDGAVHILNKRGVFKHDPPEELSTAAVGSN